MGSSTNSSEARENILRTAMTLFYRNGYKATGINEVIGASNVAKATFYAHFASKELLYLEVLKRRHDEEIRQIEDFIASKRTPFRRFMAPIEFLEQWLDENELRGCAFLNMTSEVPDKNSAMRKEGVRHYEALRQIITGLAADLIASDPASFCHLKPAQVGDDYMTVFSGAIALTQIYGEKWPVRHAVKRIRNILEKCS